MIPSRISLVAMVCRIGCVAGALNLWLVCVGRMVHPANTQIKYIIKKALLININLRLWH